MRREANALAALQHPNVVTIYDFGTDAEGPFVVMEFVEGETLGDCVERAPFDYHSFLALAEQTLAGVAAAHRAGLLHRDLKPGNVMLAATPDSVFQVKLLDFGLAKFVPRPLEQTVDQNDALFGSIYFMAPEQFHRAPLDARTDLYSLGCVFYHTLTGRHPFTGDTVAATVASHLQHDVRDLATLRQDLPEPVSGWVMRLMSLDPANRPASADEALASLRVAAHGTAAVPAVADGGTGRARRRLATGSLYLYGLGLVVAVAGLCGYFFWPTARPKVTGPPPVAAVSLFASVPVAHADGGAPGCFTIVRSGDQSKMLTVTYSIHGSAKNGIDYTEIPTQKTIRAGEASEKILIVPVAGTHRAKDDRHVRLTLVPANTYTIATPDEVKLKIVHDH